MKALDYVMGATFLPFLVACGGGGGGENTTSIPTGDAMSIDGVAFYSNNLIKNTDVKISCNNGILYSIRTNDLGFYSITIPKSAPPCGIKLTTTYNGSALTLYSAIPSDYQQLEFSTYNINYLTHLATAIVTSTNQGEWYDRRDFKNITKSNLTQSFTTLDNQLKLSGIVADLNNWNISPLNQKINDGLKYFTPQGAEVKSIESCVVHNTKDPINLVSAILANQNIDTYFNIEDFYENWAKYTQYSSSMYAKTVYVYIIAAYIYDKSIGSIYSDNSYVKRGRRLYYSVKPIDYAYLKYAAEIEKSRSGIFNGWVTGGNISPEATLLQADVNGNMIIINRQSVTLDHYKFKGDFTVGPSNCLLY